MDDAGWSLEELTRRAARALDGAARGGGARDGAGRDGEAAVSGRGRGTPDQRAIRWYASIGLVDRPVGGRGRGARYGLRHLCQVVAIKRLQAQGWAIADIQGRLAGADDVSLRELAALPSWATDPAGTCPSEPAAQPAAAEPAVARARFWAATPDVVPATGPVEEALTRLVPVVGLRIGDEVVLMLPRSPAAADLPALAEAARPLLAELAARGLLSTSPQITPGAPGAATEGAPR